MNPRIAFAPCTWLFGTAFALLFALPAAHAGDDPRWEILGGRSRTLHSMWTNTVFVERLGDTHALGPFTWSPDLGLGWLQARSTSHARLDHDVGLVALGARLYVWRGAFVSGQVALALGRTDALSSAGQFVSSIGWQGGHWVVLLRHVSDGETHKPNHGETMLLVGVGF
ncbi:MAG: lipid A 3-O-deacylase [Rhodanobacteraceae bacterium]|jgi:hypothetical protein|nr:lipid A 3-O-deacylase [Rhodanobacteraceae bacterium]